MLESFARAITDRWDCFAYTMEVSKAPPHSANAISACFASLVANIATATDDDEVPSKIFVRVGAPVYFEAMQSLFLELHQHY